MAGGLVPLTAVVSGTATITDDFAFTDGIKQSGHYLAGEALQPVETATTVRVRNGKVGTTDGPFADTKEQLGGFYMIEARDLNEAIQIASRIPSARIGTVEVRPIVPMTTSAPSLEPARETVAQGR